jgi:uncharacterized membrane protein
MSRQSVIEDMVPVATGKHMDALQARAPQESDGQGERLLFNAILYPNRSLSNTGFYVVMGIVTVVNVLSAIYYFILGAWPIIFFAGADILAVWLAFHLSYRQGRHHERLIMTHDELWVCRVLPSGHETRWRLQPFWTSLTMKRPADHDSQLQLISHGRRLIVGSFLSPAERGELADALDAALASAKQPSLDAAASNA